MEPKAASAAGAGFAGSLPSSCDGVGINLDRKPARFGLFEFSIGSLF